MATTTGGVIGTFTPDNLIAKPYPPVDAFIVELKTAGAYTRGTVLCLESDGTYSVMGASTSGSGENKKLTGTPAAILADDTAAEDTTASAYRSGHFFRNKLTVAEGYTMTDADEDNLRRAGIFLSDGV